VNEDRVEIGSVPHVKVRHVIDNYTHHTPLVCCTQTYLRRLGKRRRQRLGIVQHHEGQKSGLFMPESNVPALLRWLTTRTSVEEANERIVV
jgi:hypothetical protein